MEWNVRCGGKSRAMESDSSKIFSSCSRVRFEAPEYFKPHRYLAFYSLGFLSFGAWRRCFEKIEIENAERRTLFFHESLSALAGIFGGLLFIFLLGGRFFESFYLPGSSVF